MRIGLFGGSFNPIHNGHITLGTTMLRAMRLDEVWYMVSPHNPLKKANDLLDEQLRYDMVRRAVEKHNGLKASDYEFHLERPSYTWNTLQHLRSDYPNDTFVLIIGGDNWECFDKWAHYKDILATYEIAVFPREATTPPNLPQGEKHLIQKKVKDGVNGDKENVTIIDVPLVNVTSTMLRKMIKEGESIAQYVPHEVENYITDRGLYL